MSLPMLGESLVCSLGSTCLALWILFSRQCSNISAMSRFHEEGTVLLYLVREDAKKSIFSGPATKRGGVSGH